MTRITRSEDETIAVAREFASTLSAQGLGINPNDVSSPTFTIVHEYRGGRLSLYHADLYRLERTATEDIGLEEMGVEDGVLAIEWPDRLTHALPGAREVEIELVDEQTRRIRAG
jgi:tRNA threonylcarbamoyladenosine biosynthesis protein TsaE